MADLYIDIYFRGMVKMVLEEYDLSFFRGINRVAHEYARRLPQQPGFETTYLFGSRLPSLTRDSFRIAGIDDGLSSPPTAGLRETFLSTVNKVDRLILNKFPRYRSTLRLGGAALRAAGSLRLNNDFYTPKQPRQGDLWLSICSPFPRNLRQLPCKRVLICYDFTQVYHFRELGLPRAEIAPQSFPGIDVQEDEWVICISEYTRSCFLKFHPGFPRDRVFVVPLGADIPPVNANVKSADVLAKYGLEPEGYFLTLAAGGAHKNSAYLINEFLTWSSRQDSSNRTKLVLVGSGQNYLIPLLPEPALAAIRAGKIIFTGYAPDDHLPAFYENCIAFVFASLAEGFGLPPLEAMLHGAPVLCSDKTSLPEVVGDAGLLFDPLQEGALCHCLEVISSDQPLRASLRIKGRQRAANFTWAKSAAAFSKVLADIAALPH